MKSFEYEVVIKESLLDSFGHVNNASYLTLYEEARWDFITKNGYGLNEILLFKKGPVILDVEVRFKRELKNRELIKIVSSPIDLKQSKVLSLSQIMYKPDGKVASEAKFTIGFFDLVERKLIPASPEWLHALGI